MNEIQKQRLLYYTKTLGLVFNNEALLVKRISDTYIASFEKWCRAEGVRGGIERSKAVLTVLVSLLLRSDPVKLDVWVSVRHGLPRCLSGAHSVLKTERGAHILISIVSMHKCLVLKPVYDVSSIEDSYTGKALDDLYPRIVEEVSHLKLHRFDGNVHLEWFLSSKSGPNGQIAWTRWINDWYALQSEPLLKEALIRFMSRFPSSAALEYLKTRWKPWYPKPDHPCYTGSLSFLSEGGGKTRVVAVGDIFSQTALKPIHDYLMRCLRTIEQDGTYDQDACAERVRKWTLEGQKLYSFDLKSCTDRFPIDFQRMVLSTILGHELGGLWQSIMTQRLFWVQELQRSVSYSVGQPMGLLSSWAAMALSHHVVVRLCAREVFSTPPGKGDWDYAILGDDIVIKGSAISERYYQFVTKVLGVKITLSKSITSTESAEFCKRLYRRGVDISPIPAQLVLQVRNYPNLITTLSSDLLHRWALKCDYRRLILILPVKERWRGLELLTCPLFSTKDYSIEWGVDKAALWAAVQEEQYSNIPSIPELLQRANNSYEKLVAKDKRHRGRKWVTPPDSKLSTIVHPLYLGTSERNPKVVSGKDFIMHNLTTGADVLTPVRPLMLLTDYCDRRNPEIQRVQLLSRAIRTVKSKRGWGINYYLYHVSPSTG